MRLTTLLPKPELSGVRISPFCLREPMGGPDFSEARGSRNCENRRCVSEWQIIKQVSYREHSGRVWKKGKGGKLGQALRCVEQTLGIWVIIDSSGWFRKKFSGKN